MLERHDIKHTLELLELSKEDQKLHMNKLYDQNIDDWLMGKVDSQVILTMMKWRTRYHAR